MSIIDSPSNGLELCLGSLQEMPGGDIYEHVRRFARSGRIGYVHFRNVRGKMPRYVETFVDEGDIDMAEIVRILRDENYQGRNDPRPHAGDELCCLSACRQGICARIHARARAERPRARTFAILPCRRCCGVGCEDGQIRYLCRAGWRQMRRRSRLVGTRKSALLERYQSFSRSSL